MASASAPSAAAVEATLGVLELCRELEDGTEDLHPETAQPSLTPVFKAIRGICRVMTRKRLDGLDLHEYVHRKAKARLKALLQERRVEDERLRNRCALRKGRSEKRQAILAALREVGEEEEATAPVPDGPVHVSAEQQLALPAATEGREEGEKKEEKEAQLLFDFRPCYVCKQRFRRLHHFYDQLCPTCAELNWAKRLATGDLSGKVALVTGGRVKIGMEVVRKLLDAGARVLLTTRFPLDAAQRYAALEGYETWSDRLEIYGLDLRDLAGVEAFAARLSAYLPRLDILIHNAAQTIRRPPEFYSHLADLQTDAWTAIGAREQRLLPIQSSEAPVVTSPQSPSLALVDNPWKFPTAAPARVLDANGQALDLRPVNSWKLRLAEVPSSEMAEVMAINSLAPAILTAKLKPLLVKATPIVGNEASFVINVSAMEGSFARPWKSPRHPHTNMAKAALNMMTRTSAGDYAESGIYMSSVDTGWINDENPAAQAAQNYAKTKFTTPLDEVDGAARILAPIFDWLNRTEPSQLPTHGHFLKDYASVRW